MNMEASYLLKHIWARKKLESLPNVTWLVEDSIKPIAG